MPTYADWSGELSRLLAAKNYRTADTFLEANQNEIFQRDKAFVRLASAYIAAKSGNKEEERKHIIDFFETYGGMADTFPLSNDRVNKQIGNYLRAWRKSYPMVFRFGFVRGPAFDRSILPVRIPLGIEVGKACNYRLLHGSAIVGAGVLQKGFNLLTLPVEGLLMRSGNHDFYLEFKLRGFILRRRLVLDVASRFLGNSRQVKEEHKRQGYGVSMSIENHTVATHTKASRLPQKSVKEEIRDRVRLNRQGRRPPDPFDITGTKKYRRMSLPVLALPVLAFKHLIKPFFKKKKKKRKKAKPVPTFNRLESIFLAPNAHGEEQPLALSVGIASSVVRQ
ncbi:MAG: hypothetical protein GY765_22360, partial [bacterium]|nr:hypothetical protein [bacterium]